MTRYTTKAVGDTTEEEFDPIETDLHTRVSGFIETLIEEELATALSRPRHGRRLGSTAANGQTHQLTPPPSTTYVPPRCPRFQSGFRSHGIM
jgi:hypothetical protein